MEELGKQGLTNAHGEPLWLELSHDGVQALNQAHCVPQDLTYRGVSNFGLSFGTVVNELGVPWLTFRRPCFDGVYRKLSDNFGERCTVCSFHFNHTPSLPMVNPQVDEFILEQLTVDPLGALILVPLIRETIASFWVSPPPVETMTTRVLGPT